MNREDLLTHVAEDMAFIRRRMWACAPSPSSTGLPTRAQIGLLFMIAHEDSPNPKALAERLGTTPSAVTQLIDGLIKERMLIRTEDPSDRRRIRLSLSEEGKSRLAEMKKAHIASLTKLSSPLSEPELTSLHHLLKKMIDHTN